MKFKRKKPQPLTPEDKAAIERVDFLLEEFAWTNEPLTKEAESLKREMVSIFERWKDRESVIRSRRNMVSYTFSAKPVRVLKEA